MKSLGHLVMDPGITEDNEVVIGAASLLYL